MSAPIETKHISEVVAEKTVPTIEKSPVNQSEDSFDELSINQATADLNVTEDDYLQAKELAENLSLEETRVVRPI